ncbi:putative uncharacterized protein C6orf52 homolog [Trichosurus vulpecula]|uniref:putative uncharacterized protein C6orf52 homolog n=1 Tax=Trichosurus vulpecula TaxID=9337 RepID=UPI00186AEB8B|nr:putative uncharacterized protein C6orf52 homolog [Trichosurus vulpecula]
MARSSTSIDFDLTQQSNYCWYWQRMKAELQLDNCGTYYQQHQTCYLQSDFEPHFEYNYNFIFYENVQNVSSAKESTKHLAEIPPISEAWTTNNEEEQTEDPQIPLDIENLNKEFMVESEELYDSLMNCHWQPLDTVASRIPNNIQE